MRRYIPPAVLPRLADGQSGYLAEMRTVSVVFVMVNGVDLVADSSNDCTEVSLRLPPMLTLEKGHLYRPTAHA